jgi:predicted exporter
MNSAQQEPTRSAGPAKDRLWAWMVRWYGLLQRHRMMLTIVLLILGGALFAASNRIVWQTSLLNFFSTRSAAIHDLRLSQNRNGLADAMRLDVHFASGTHGNLPAAVRALGVALGNTHEFSTLWYGTPQRRQLKAALAMGRMAPALLTHQQRAKLRRRLSAGWLETHFHRQLHKIAGPDGQLAAAQLQQDPLDVRQLLQSSLTAYSPGSGAHFSGALLMSRDDHHAMMILAPPFKPGNVAASKKMLSAIRAAIVRVRKKYPGLRVWMVGPYRNFVENQRLVKHDLKIISLAGTLLVAAVIAFYFRRAGAVVICLVPPVVGLGAALGIAGIFAWHIPLIVLGFDGLLCGATTDYGIQLMAAMNRMVRRAGRFEADMPARAARELFGPISMSVCTSMTGYGALAASSAPGLRTLGLFIAGATGCIWLVTFLVLPAYLGPWVVAEAKCAGGAGGDEKGRWRKCFENVFKPRPWPAGLNIVVMVAFILMTLWLASQALMVRYTRHGRSLDGSTARLKQQEAMFAHVWGHLRDSGVITIHRPSAGDVLAELHKLNAELEILKQQHLIAGYATPAAILPDAQTVRRRMAAWRAFWNPQRIHQAKVLLAHAVNANGMRMAAFAGAIKSWQAPESVPDAMRRLRQSPAMLLPGVVDIGPRRISISSTVQLNTGLAPDKATQWAANVRQKFPDISIICGQVLYLNASRRAQGEAIKLFPWVALLILIPMWIYFRRLDIAAVAALSLGIGFIWLLGAAQWLGGGLNLLSLVPILFTMGVAVDYGIYAASDPAVGPGGGADGNRNAATFVCAATTILGAAAMMLAGHPVLHWIGITLTAGILGGYLASYFIVRPLATWILKPPAAEQPLRRIALGLWRIIVLAAMLVLLLGILGGCCSVPAPQAYVVSNTPAPSTAMAQKNLAAFPRRWDRQFFAQVNWRGHRLSMIGQLKGTYGRAMRITCASEFGTLLFDDNVMNHDVSILHRAAGVPTRLAHVIGGNIARALRLPAAAKSGAAQVVHQPHELIFSSRRYCYLFAGRAGKLRVCRSLHRASEIEIQYGRYGSGESPGQVIIWDGRACLRMTLNFIGRAVPSIQGAK